jgi:energy-converting hydrogenase A subunit R
VKKKMTKKDNNVICFDLEGPLSPQDNAYEVMGLIPEGHKIFEVISKYDDLLTLEGRKCYEPGDTLSLIVPFLIFHDISEEDIKTVSRKAKIVDGAGYVISRLKESLHFDVYIISTSYQQHAFNIGEHLNVEKENIYCTKFPLDEFKKNVHAKDFSLIENVENDILEKLYPSLDDDEAKIKQRLDEFFWHDLPRTELGALMKEVRVIGGGRKVEAMNEILKLTRKKAKEIIVVGDSITDFKMLEKVKKANGISIVFNGNEYVLPYGNIGLATQNMRFLLIIAEAFLNGGRSLVMEIVKEWESRREEFIKNPKEIPPKLIPEEDVKKFLIEKISKDEEFMPPYFHVLENISEEKQMNIAQIHKKFRAFVRGEATAKLG